MTDTTHGAEPLVEIERRVQARAKSMALDPRTDSGGDVLRGLIDEEVAQWDLDHARGRRPFPLPDPGALAARAWRDIAGYGPLAPLLDDADVWEIMINAPTAVFVKRHRGDDGYHHEVFRDDDHVTRVVTRILDDAVGAHRKLDPAEGLQDAQLASGARLHIVHGDLTRGGHLLVNIRKFAAVAYRDLDDLVSTGMLSVTVARFLAVCARAGRTIVIAGPPGSGKTTLLGCCAAALDPASRVVQAEEVFEVDVPLANVAAMQTRPGRPDRPEIGLRRLVAGFLRMAPDVAIVGEVRHTEALPLLLTLSSGVQG
ncbi:MAG TPA: ATPase, T2SS/T4P/T4SS family, partial [Acidimicrobiales bacterium]|nr:ATPase, T2SS/T4P/T4SS family [Acidimicrobiales bacterium]